MNPDLARLQPYPFEKLAALKAGIEPPAVAGHIALSIGEPKHPTPALITETLIAHLHQLSAYPTTRGQPALREAIADWLTRAFELPAGRLDPERQILPGQRHPRGAVRLRPGGGGPHAARPWC